MQNINHTPQGGRRLSILVWFLSVVLVWNLSPVLADEARPNFIIIMADDMGYGDTSVNDGWIKTPALERMAKGGLRFTDFHSSGNVCSPTRAGLMTGRYQQRAGIPGVINANPRMTVHYTGLQDLEITLPEQLRDNGYGTAVFGKWHLGYEIRYNPTHHGFEEFKGYVSGNVDFLSHYDNQETFDWWHGLKKVREPGYVTHLITRHALQFLRGQDPKGKPFCLYLAHEAVHSPYQGPNDPITRGPDKPAPRKRTRPIKDIYRDMMHEMDRGIGEILDLLEKKGLSENTLVFFFSDNGANKHGSNGVYRGFKGSDWEGGHRVPALAYWPGKIKAGQTSDQLAITLDIMPTLLDLAGVAASKDRPLDGISLKPLLLEGKALGTRQLFWNGLAMREGPWKLMTPGRRQPMLALFNLLEDPGETRNVADQHPQRLRSMQLALEAWKQDVMRNATPQPQVDPEKRK